MSFFDELVELALRVIGGLLVERLRLGLLRALGRRRGPRFLVGRLHGARPDTGLRVYADGDDRARREREDEREGEV